MRDSRPISKDISLSESVAALGSAKAALIATWLIVHADDQGRMVASTRRLKAAVFPLLDDISEEDIEAALQQMAGVGMITLYDGDGQRLLQFLNWWKWNSEQRYTRQSRLPPPPGWVDRPAGRRRRPPNPGESQNAAVDGVDSANLQQSAENFGNLQQNAENFGNFRQITEKCGNLPTEYEHEIEIEEKEKGKGKGKPKAPVGALAPPPTAPGGPEKRRDDHALRALFASLVALTGLDPQLSRNRGRLNRLAADLYDAGYRVSDVEHFSRWWTAHDWRGRKGERPTPELIISLIGQGGHGGQGAAGSGRERPIDYEKYLHGEYSDLFGSSGGEE